MNSKNTNTKFSFGCLAFVVLIWIIAYLYGQNKKRQERQAEKEIEHQRQRRNTTYEILLPKDTVQYRKTKHLTPKQKRELEEEAQYEWDVREEAEGQMDERGVDEPY